MALLLALGACAEPGTDGADAPIVGDTAGVQAGQAADTVAPPPDAVSVTLREWSVELASDSVAPGAVSFSVTNGGTVPHAFEIEGNGEEWATPPLEPGGSLTMTVNLAAGEYRVYCPVDTAGVNHESRGMVTQLRVQ